MADNLANSFDDLGPDKVSNLPSPAIQQQEIPTDNSFDDLGPKGAVIPDANPLASFARSAAMGTAPALGSLPAASAGAEALGEAGLAVGGPFGALAGGVIGGLAGAIGGSTALSAAQNWAISALPDSWQESISRTQRADQMANPTASFLGGLLPYAMTMKPGNWRAAALPEGATAIERLMANPLTAHLFGGAVMGGMELGQESASGESPDWTKVAISTGFGMIWNKPTQIGEAINELGAAPVRAGIAGLRSVFGTPKGVGTGVSAVEGLAQPSAELPITPAENLRQTGTAWQDPYADIVAGKPLEAFSTPAAEVARAKTLQEIQSKYTLAQAADEKIMGPGITEPVFMGTQEGDPAAIQTNQEAVRTENSIIRPYEQPAPDLHTLARKIEPELFAQWDELTERRETFRQQLDQMKNPTSEDLQGIWDQKTALEDQLENEPNKTAQRQLNAQIRDLQTRYDAAYEQRHAISAGDTPEMAVVRKNLTDTDLQMRDMAADVSAANRRAAEMAGNPEMMADHETSQAVPEVTAEEPPQAEVNTDTLQTPEATPAAAQRTPEEQHAAIVQDVAAKLQKTGMSADEAASNGEVQGAFFRTMAETYGGTKGNAEDWYAREGANIQGEGAKAERVPEMAQNKQGRIRLAKNAKATITLLKTSNASTFIHESGHHFLDIMDRYAKQADAPQRLKDDVDIIKKYLKTKDGGTITNAQHEKFARSFERYLMEGTAPSKQLSGVFAKFKVWLTNIYQTVAKLRAPITDDIRGVMDRMLATTPERTVITPESEIRPTLADIHEADAAHTEPADAAAVRERVRAEKTAYLENKPIEIQNEIAQARAETESAAAGSNAAPEGAGEPAGRTDVERPGGEPEPVPAGSAGGAEHGEVQQGGAEPGATGAGISREPGNPTAAEPARGPNTPFPARDTATVDLAGNIRVENVTDKESLIQAIKDSAERNNDFIGDRQGRISRGQMMDTADALGMSLTDVMARKIGEAWNCSQIIAVRKLLVNSASIVSDAMKKAATGTDQDVAALAVAVARHDLIQSQVAGVTAEWGRAGHAFRSLMEGWQQAQDVNQFLKENTGRTLYQMKEMAKKNQALETTQQISKMVVDSRKRTWGKMLLEYFINNLISGPITHSTYAVGNTALMVNKTAVEAPVAAAIGAIRQGFGREGNVIQLGEAAARAKGAVTGLAGATKAAIEAARTGVTTLLPGEEARETPFLGDITTLPGRAENEVSLSNLKSYGFGIARGVLDSILAHGELIKAGGIENAPAVGLRYSSSGAIPDITIKGVGAVPLGTAVRLPGRAIAVIHSFFRTLNYSIEKSGLAYRTATDETSAGSLAHENFDKRIAELRQNPTQQIMEQASGEATNLTLMGQGGEFTRKLQALVSHEVYGVQPLKFIDPFINVSSNIINQSFIQRTPLGLLTEGVRADMSGKNGNIAQDMAMARMLVGSAYGIGMGTLAAMGYASGSGPSDRNQAAAWRMAGNQAHSVRVGDMWYAVNRLGPLGMLLSTTADMYDVAHNMSHEDGSAIASSITHAFMQNILDESFMRGPADLIKALEDSDRYGAGYVRTFLSSFVPYSVGMAQMDRMQDPYSRQARTLMDTIKSKIPGLSETLLPRRDIWGQPMPNHERLGGATAIYEQQMSRDPVNQALFNIGVYPAPPARKIGNVELTDQQYDDYSRIAGRMTKMRLDTLVRSSDFQSFSSATKHDVFEEAIRQSRETARGVMMMKYPQIPQQSTTQKRARVYGDQQ